MRFWPATDQPQRPQPQKIIPSEIRAVLNCPRLGSKRAEADFSFSAPSRLNLRESYRTYRTYRTYVTYRNSFFLFSQIPFRLCSNNIQQIPHREIHIDQM